MTKTTRYFNEAFQDLLHEFQDQKEILYPFVIGVLLVSDAYPSKEESQKIIKLIRKEAIGLKSAYENIKLEYEAARAKHEDRRIKIMEKQNG